MEEPTNVPPVDNPQDADPGDGQGDGPETPAKEPQSDPWWGKLGFQDEQTAVESYGHLRSKLSEQGRELNQLKRSQTQAQQPSGQADPLAGITAEQLWTDTPKILALASETGARKALAEYAQAQESKRMIEDAARKEGVETWELEEAYNDMQTDPRRAVEILAAVTKLKRGVGQGEAIQQAVRDAASNKARAAQAPSGATVPEAAEPDWDSMDFPTMVKEMQKRGMSVPEGYG